MENAHLRLGLLEYVRITEKTSTRIRLRVDRYIGEDRQAHLLSVFGNDSDVGAITAAVHEKAAFSLTFPDGETKEVSLGEHASCYKGAVDTARPETPSASFTRGLSGTAHQRHRRKNSAAALPARGGVGHAREFSGPPSRPNMGRPHPWSCRTEEDGSRRSTESAASRCWFQRPRRRCWSGSARGCGQELWPSRARPAQSCGRDRPLRSC